jgi:hypothetical protein
MNPAIVINAYNRPAALGRLLGSIREADYPQGGLPIPLVISLDASAEHPDVASVAEAFEWTRGPVQVIRRDAHLGPVGHFYACGGLAQEHGAIVYLEDDLFAGRDFYHYARQALEFYADDPCIAGISLYALWFNGYTRHPFIPLADGGDAFFLQVPYTQGLAFTGEQWRALKAWRDAPPPPGGFPYPLHESWAHFKPDEWFPELTRYVVASGKYFAYPRVSQATGFGDAGTHFAAATPFFQAPLEYGKQDYAFLSLQEALAVYDSFFEILPDRLDRLTPRFHGQEYTVDLYATRSAGNIRTPYVLTTRPARKAVATFGQEMQPQEANVTHGVPGEAIVFCRTEDLRWGRLADWEAERKNDRYFARGRRMGVRRALRGMVVDGLKKIGKTG